MSVVYSRLNDEVERTVTDRMLRTREKQIIAQFNAMPNVRAVFLMAKVRKYIARGEGSLNAHRAALRVLSNNPSIGKLNYYTRIYQ